MLFAGRLHKYLGVMAIAMSVVFIAMIALPKLTQQMQALSHRNLPEPKNLGPFDIEPSLVSIPTNPWTFHLGKFAFQFPIDFQPYNSKANSIEFVRDTPELRATNGEMLTWYSIHSLPPKEVAPFTREWYNIEQKRLEDDGLKVLSMDEGTLMGSRCMRAVVEKDHIPARQGLPRLYLYGKEYQAIRGEIVLRVRFLTTFRPETPEYSLLNAICCSVYEEAE